MRKRWQINLTFSICAVGAWLILGLVGVIVTCALTTPCDAEHHCGLSSTAPLSTADSIAFALWIGPFAGGIAIAGIVCGARALWENRPRRLSEPVLEDLRERPR